MPSNLKYRIKKTSESKRVTLKPPEADPNDVMSMLPEEIYYPSTCTFTVARSKTDIVCDIKRITNRPHLKAGEGGDGCVTGAENIEDGNYSIPFKCKYVFKPEEYPRCSCYTPLGGLQITHFDGAVQDTLDPNYEFENVSRPSYLGLLTLGNTPEGKKSLYSGLPVAVPKAILKQTTLKFPATPKKLGYVYMMLNARAVVAKCCYWTGDPLIYNTDMFRVIDLARLSDKNSKVAEYVKRDSDIPDNYFHKVLLGRFYDSKLPECGNNRRVIYVLDDALTGPLVNTPVKDDKDCASNDDWHFDSPFWFSPKNCCYPDCKVRYTWGAMCNGGGSFKLETGEACPYYTHPVMGPEKGSTKHSRLKKMYPGDTITAGAMLELMWMSRGGRGWEKEEWESVWKEPYIWATMPFNPVKLVRGDVFSIDNEVKTYAVKTEINLATGEVTQGEPCFLPGGSRVKKRSDGSDDPKSNKPDAPTVVGLLQFSTIDSLRHIWPVAAVEQSGRRATTVSGYTHYMWDRSDDSIMVMGSALGYFTGGIFAVNTSLFKEYKPADMSIDDIITYLDSNKNIMDEKLQKNLRDFILDMQVGARKVSDFEENGGLYKATLGSFGIFYFPMLPLNLKVKENKFIVLGVNRSSFIDAYAFSVKPKFMHAYIYQTKATLAAGWKTVWSGRPSILVDAATLHAERGPKFDEGVSSFDLFKRTKPSYISSVFSGEESAEELTGMMTRLASAIEETTKTINNCTDKNAQSKYRLILDGYMDQASELSARISKAMLSPIKAIKDPDELIEEIKRKITDTETNLKMIANQKSQTAEITTFYENLKTKLEEQKEGLNVQLASLEALGRPSEDGLEPSAELKPNWAVEVSKDEGDPDTFDGRGLTDATYEDADLCYIPHFSKDKSEYHNLCKSEALIPEIHDQLVDLDIPVDSGISEWGYVNLVEKHPVVPKQGFVVGGNKRVVVYSTGSAAEEHMDKIDIAPIAKIGIASPCFTMFTIAMDPRICNRYNEFMVFEMSAEITTSGGTDTYKCAPIDYIQVPRKFPAYDIGNKLYACGGGDYCGVSFNGTSVSGNIDIMELPGRRRNPWILFAMPCRDQTKDYYWGDFSGEGLPSVEGVVISNPTSAKINMSFAFIKDIYDCEDYKQLDWEGNTYKTFFQHTHPKGGLFKTLFSYEEEEGSDGYKELVVGAKTMSTLWPYARLACRDYEIHYIWKEVGYYNRVTARYPVAYRGLSRSSAVWGAFEGGADFFNPYKATQYVPGDHDLGTVFKPKLTYHRWERTAEQKKIRSFDPKKMKFISEEQDYTWNRGYQEQAGYPTDTFPVRVAESYTNFNKPGPLYYPYTRSDPYSKFVPIHPVYIWDFLVHYRNKFLKKEYFGGQKFMMPDMCGLVSPEKKGGFNGRDTLWQRYFRINQNPRYSIAWLGRAKTRGPVFQLEYEEYEEKKPKVVFLRARATGGTEYAELTSYTAKQNIIGYPAVITTTGDEDWEPSNEDIPQEQIFDFQNPDTMDEQTWRAICRHLAIKCNEETGSSRSSCTAYTRHITWGSVTRGWVYPSQPKQISPLNTNVSLKDYLEKAKGEQEAYLKYLLEEKAKTSSSVTIFELDQKISETQGYLASIDIRLANQTGSTGEGIDPTAIGGDPCHTDLVTGCHKSTSILSARGSFAFDNTYLPGSVTVEGLKEKKDKIIAELKKKSVSETAGFYTYEQKSFGINIPWSPYDYSPVFGNTGRELSIVELCCIGGMISWIPKTEEGLAEKSFNVKWSVENTEASGVSVPSWWTGGTPSGRAIEAVVLMAPEAEASRAITPLVNNNPFYYYHLDDVMFKEKLPTTVSGDLKLPSSFRLTMSHSFDNYGKTGNRSDVGRLVLTPKDSSDLGSIRVIGNIKSSTISSLGLITPKSKKPQTPTPVLKESPNTIKGSDLQSIPASNQELLRVGDYYPGYDSPQDGRAFIGYENDVMWAWPTGNRNDLIRGVKFGYEGSEESGEKKMFSCFPYLKCPPYVKKLKTINDGEDQDLGPPLKEGDEKTKYLIVVKSEREVGGILQPPLVWAKQQDGDMIDFTLPNDWVINRVNVDGSLTPVRVQDNVITALDMSNVAPGGNFIVKSELNGAGMYPAFDIGPIDYLMAGKVKKTERVNLEEIKLLVTKFNNKLFSIQASVPWKKVSAIQRLKIGYNYDFKELINKEKNDRGSLSININGFPLPGSYTYQIPSDADFVETLPISQKVSDSPEGDRVYFANLGLTSRSTMTFEWLLKCCESGTGSQVCFDQGPWGPENLEARFSTECHADEAVVYNDKGEKGCVRFVGVGKSGLDVMLSRLEVDYLVPSTFAEVVEIEEKKFVVSTSEIKSKSKDRRYNFYSESLYTDYICEWEESERGGMRNWDTESMFGVGATMDSKGKAQKMKNTKFAEAGYNKSRESFIKAGFEYNKNPKATAFPNSCVETPELPYSKLKIEAWNKYGDPSDPTTGSGWATGGIWTTRVAGPEWRDEDYVRSPLWFPALPYHKGEITLKGRKFVFNEQYKDEALVMAKNRQVHGRDKYNKEAYKNELSPYDILARNIQEVFINERYEAARSFNSRISGGERNANDERLERSMAQHRRLANTVESMGPVGAIVGAAMHSSLNSIAISVFRPFQDWHLGLDDVGMEFVNADWSKIEHLESQQELIFNEANELIKTDEIKAKFIIPFNDWNEIRYLSGNQITENDLKNIKEDAVFKWKKWTWDEVRSFTFRDEPDFAYQPEGDLSSSKTKGMLRKCGKRWTVNRDKTEQTVGKYIPNLLKTVDSLRNELQQIKPRSDNEKEDIQSIINLLNCFSTFVTVMGGAVSDVSEKFDKILEVKPNKMDPTDAEVLEALKDLTDKGVNIIIACEGLEPADPPAECTRSTVIECKCSALSVAGSYTGIIKWSECLWEFHDLLDKTDVPTRQKKDYEKLKQQVEDFVYIVKDASDQFALYYPAIKQYGFGHRAGKYFYSQAAGESAAGISGETLSSVRVDLQMFMYNLYSGHTTTTGIIVIDCNSDKDLNKEGYCEQDGYEYKWEWDKESGSEDWPKGTLSGTNIKDGLLRPDPWWRY